MLSVRDLYLGYSGEPVLAGVGFDVAEQEFASLVGPSGSGKSSLLRAISELHTPDGGRVDLSVDASDVAFLFQDDALLPWRTVRHNAALGLMIRGERKRSAYATAETWLSRLGVGGLGDRFPRQLSGGQRKRVALAQVLALQPRLLLMDEPFASLDAIVRHRVTEDLLGWVEAEDITVLLITHDLEEAITVSDRVHLLTQGPRAHIAESYEVPLARPRDLVGARTDPAFGPLLRRVWDDLEAVSDDAPPRAAAEADQDGPTRDGQSATRDGQAAPAPDGQAAPAPDGQGAPTRDGQAAPARDGQAARQAQEEAAA